MYTTFQTKGYYQKYYFKSNKISLINIITYKSLRAAWKIFHQQKDKIIIIIKLQLGFLSTLGNIFSLYPPAISRYWDLISMWLFHLLVPKVPLDLVWIRFPLAYKHWWAVNVDFFIRKRFAGLRYVGVKMSLRQKFICQLYWNYSNSQTFSARVIPPNPIGPRKVQFKACTCQLVAPEYKKFRIACTYYIVYFPKISCDSI